MKMYVLTECCYSFVNSFKVLDVYSDRDKAEKEARRLSVENNPQDYSDDDPPQYSLEYVVEEREVVE